MALTIPSLHDDTKPGIGLRFTINGSEHTLESWVNKLTGDRLTNFDGALPYIGHTVTEVRQMISGIRKKGRILETVGAL